MHKYAGLSAPLAAAVPTRRLPYRADIDGLRAISILLVVAFHAVPKAVRGGFVGVDVFFVISGFLISGLILEGLKDGSFSFVAFYVGRARRLFPALILVLLTTWLLGWFVLVPTEYTSFGRHLVAGAAFAANLSIYSETGYFDAPAVTKPLLHLWSLGVEEQFYLFFPAFLVLLWRYRSIGLWLTITGVVSFALNIALYRSQPALTFYLPATRFWEFLAGAVIAYGAANQTGVLSAILQKAASPSVRDWTALVGLIAIILGVVFSNNHNFPGWAALWPVGGAVLIIAAGTEARLNRTVLARPKVVFIGLISYPLYLWHWPLLVLGRMAAQDAGAGDKLGPATIIAVVLSFVLAWLTFEFVERPVRSRRSWGGTRWTIPGLGASLICLAALGIITFRHDGFPERYPPEVRALLTPLKLGEDFPPIAALTWDTNEQLPLGRPLVAVWGDSHAGHLLPGLRWLQQERSFQFALVGGWGPCSPVGDIKADDAEGCAKETSDNQKLMAKLKPDIVIIAAFWKQYPHIERIVDHLQFLRQIGVRRIVIVGTVPAWPLPPQKLLYQAFQADSQHRIPTRLPNVDPAARRADAQLSQIVTRAGATYVSAFDVLCDDAAGCLARLGSTHKDIVQVDLTHFSAVGSWFLVSHIADRIFD